MADHSSLSLSDLNHWACCPSRCALIHLEGEFADNVHTVRGTAEHRRVDWVAYDTKQPGAWVEYALPVWSDRIGLIGRCDAVEFWPDGIVYPAEYKCRACKKWLNDDHQPIGCSISRRRHAHWIT
ncbi:MAG: hypothetical protein AB7E78_14240 [Porticoccaceae bacterium]